MNCYSMQVLYTSMVSKVSGTVVRWISTISRPRWLARLIVRIFIKCYSISTDEIEHKVQQYTSLLDFFLRRLKPESRPMNTDAVVIISPVDAEITAAGTADGDMVLLVKGMPYSIRELVGTDTELYDGGAFVMLYLSPADCHRIYAPCDALVTGSWFIDGRLRPVYPAAVEKYPRTFITNKRIITELRSDLGTMIMAKIGALNVGRIPVKHPLPCTEQKCFSYRKGEELGRFEFGSTIVLLFEKGRYKLGETVVVGRKIKIGEAIASSC